MIREKEPLVSVIMPAFNCEAYIGEAIDSVVKQHYQNWEIIIADDCSKDGTKDIVEGYGKRDPRISYLRLPENRGAAVARNKAIEKASGAYLAFLDSDDLWYPEKLQEQIDFMERNRVKFSCTAYGKIDDRGMALDRKIVPQGKSDYMGLLKNCPGNSTVVYHAESLGKFFIPDIKKRNDYVMWLKVIKKAGYLYGIPKELSVHRIRKEGISSNKRSLIAYHWKVYREFEGLSRVKSLFLIAYWIKKSVVK